MSKPILDDRACELLADRALGVLDDADARELDALGLDDDESFERAAAALAVATLPRETLPPALAAKLLAAAPHETAVRSPWRHAGWLAAAAALVLAVGTWWWSRQPAPAPRVVTVTVPVPVAPPPAPSAETARAALLKAPDAEQLAWKPTRDPAAAGVSGDVVWSDREQRGYMRFVGLAPNDPRQQQYQLWIFDAARDQAFPVDGGVFDVGANGEVIVPIHSKLAVSKAALFAITIERPGGVVVSKREHIVVTAAPPA